MNNNEAERNDCENLTGSNLEDKNEKMVQGTFENRNENFVAGIVGAFIGSLIGVVAIIFLGQLGYVASISGLIMAVCTLKGYQLLGGTLSKFGIICSCIIILFMIYVGCRMNWAYSLMKYYRIDLFTAFRSITGEYIDMSVFIKDLVMVYGFSLLGAVPTIKREMKNNSSKN